MSIATKKIYHLTGLSTDTKQIPADISTGSTFLETDTGITYVYNKTMNAWMISKNTEVPQIDAPCRGILSIDLTSTAGLVDTYTIKYTNGSETTFEVVNGAYVEVNPNIKPMTKNKVYTLDINTIKYNLYKSTVLNGGGVVFDQDTKQFNLVSDVISRQIFWPKKDEGFFVLKMKNSDTEYVFNYTGQTVAGHDIWQAMAVTDQDEFVRYVGHFEYTDLENIDSSDYYFIAKPQKISFKDLKAAIDDEITRAKNEETYILEALSEVDAALADEITRAKDAEVTEYNRATEVEADLEGRMVGWDDLIQSLKARLVKEETYSFLADKELEIKIKKLKEDTSTELALKADLFNETQTIIADNVKVCGTFEAYCESKELETADQLIGGTLSAVEQESELGNTKLVLAAANALVIDGNNSVAVKAKTANLSAADIVLSSTNSLEQNQYSTEITQHTKKIVAEVVDVTSDINLAGDSTIEGNATITGAVTINGNETADTINVVDKLTATNAELIDTDINNLVVKNILTSEKVLNASTAFVKDYLQVDSLATLNKEVTFNDRIVTSNIAPKEDDTFDLGNTKNKYKDLYLSGSVFVDNDGITDFELKFPKVNDTLVGSIEFNTAIQAASDALNTEQVRAIQAETDINNSLTAEIARATTEEARIDTYFTAAVLDINNKIPNEATIDNKLADKEFVNSSIASATATFRGNYDVTSLTHNGTPLTVNASHADVEEALFDNEGDEPRLKSPKNNDYVIIGYPDPQDIPDYTKFERYKFTIEYDPQTQEPIGPGAWEWEYTLNHSSFTAEQWAAINSNITAVLTQKVKDIYDEHIVTSVIDIVNAPDSDAKHYPSTSYLEDRLATFNNVVVIPEINAAVTKLIADNLTLSIADWDDIDNALNY